MISRTDLGSSLLLRYAAATDIGAQRDRCEDYFAILEEARLFAVADGIGGHAAGEIAAKLTVDTLCEFFRRTHGPVRDRLRSGIQLANLLLRREAAANAARRGMGTTIVAAVLDGPRAHIAHVGDSRAYRLRRGELMCLTRDHSLLQELVDDVGMSPQAQRDFARRHIITRAVGLRETIAVDLTEIELLPGDRLLLCSDGLSNMVDERTLCERLGRSMDLALLVSQLVELANAAGGTDNVTALLVEPLAREEHHRRAS